MITWLRKKGETGFSLLELSVAVGVAAIVASAGVVATTVFINDSAEKRDDYTVNANRAIEDAESSSLALTTEALSLSYTGVENNSLIFERGVSSQSFMPTNIIEGATYSITGGTLPEGVSLNPNTGALTGPETWGFETKSTGGPDWNRAASISVTPDGGAIITGEFEETTSFGDISLTSEGAWDIFVAKVDPSGDFEWATSAGGAGWDYGYSAASTADGGAIITGYFEGTAFFDTIEVTSSGTEDVFVAKIDSNGDFAWVSAAGGSGSDYGNSVTITPDGGAIITGDFESSATFGTTTLTSSGYSDTFTAKVDTDGGFVWATRAGGTSSDSSQSATATDDGGAIITGYFYNSTTFGSTSLSSPNSWDVFVAKISNTGVFEWASRAGGSNNNYSESVTATVDGGAIITGYFSGTASFGPTNLTSVGASDIFVAKVDPSGDFEWATRAGGVDADYGQSVTATVDGGAIITGYFSGAADFGSTNLNASGVYDIFVAKVDPSGGFEWASHAGGAGIDAGYSVSSTDDGGAVMTGLFEGTADFGNTSINSEGSYDTFVSKVSSAGEISVMLQGSTEEVTITVTNGENTSDFTVTISTE